MRNHKQRAFALLKHLLEPCDRFIIDMVGRLIEQQDIGWLNQRRRHGDPLALSAG